MISALFVLCGPAPWFGWVICSEYQSLHFAQKTLFLNVFVFKGKRIGDFARFRLDITWSYWLVERRQLMHNINDAWRTTHVSAWTVSVNMTLCSWRLSAQSGISAGYLIWDVEWRTQRETKSSVRFSCAHVELRADSMLDVSVTRGTHAYLLIFILVAVYRPNGGRDFGVCWLIRRRLCQGSAFWG